MKHADHAPALAFGRARSIEFDNPDAMSAGLASAGRATLTYRRVETAKPFYSRSAEVQTPHARIVASASSAVEVEAEAPSSVGVLLVPLYGTTVARYGGREVEWGLSQGAAYLPSDRCTAVATERSVASIDIDPLIMEPILQTMLGGSDEGRIASAIDYGTPRLVGGGRDNSDLERVLLHHIASFDRLNADARIIARTGIDDVILRTAALMLWRDVLVSSRERSVRGRTALDLACGYADAHLTERITLTDLERISGLSARSLQYAFRSAFDCTPMQWVARRRLAAVRKRILSAREGDSLTSIAGDYFNNLGDFARLYKLSFGELPSRTLQDVLARRFRT